MPIYEYKCGKCDEEFEALVFRTDEELWPVRSVRETG